MSTHSSELAWLYQTQLYGIKLGLENMQKLLQAMGLPAAGMKFIHVAGTNGKGSTCAFIHAMLRQAGIRAGLFTSPHLIRFHERIRDDEREITDEELQAGLAELRVLVADWQPHPTFFELTFALALRWFQQRGLEWAVLETGLGGRLDATNVITPEVSVITRISYDHMAQLGDSLTAITGEKAGIIKPGVPVVTGMQDVMALHVIRRVAEEKQAPLLEVDGPITKVAVGLAGPHQAWNAALALDAVREVGVRLPAVELEKALLAVDWPGRFQQLEDGQLILDGAHNAEAAMVLAGTWQKLFPGEKAEIFFAAAKDKDVIAVMESLSSIVGAWHFTVFNSPRAVPTATLREMWSSMGKPTVPITEHGSLPAAWLAAPLAAGRLRRLVCGSLYLVGEALAIQQGRPDSYQGSLQ